MTHIHYKFSSKLSYDTVVFDGPHITLRDLKRQIMGREKLRAGDCDLQITNAQSKEEYIDDEGVIPKGSSVIVRRIPVSGGKSSSSGRTSHIETSAIQFHHTFVKAVDDQSSSRALPFLAKMANLAEADVSEEDKIKVMLNQSTYDSMNYKKFSSVLPANYTCYRCGNTGHHIRNCPTTGDKNFEAPLRIRKSTGIPRSFMVEVDDPNMKGAMLTNSGRYAIPAIDAEAYAIGKKEKPPFIPQEKRKSEAEEDPAPDELLCLICRDLLSDAVVIPCCGNSYCDDCIRTTLLDSEEHVCPTCSQSDVSPDTLIANKFLRQAVNNFKKERGYTKSFKSTCGASQSHNLITSPSPVTMSPPIIGQSQPPKPLQPTYSQQVNQDSLQHHPNVADAPLLSGTPPVAAATSADSTPSTCIEPEQSCLKIPDEKAEEKTQEDSVEVDAAPSVPVLVKEPSAAPSQWITVVSHTAAAEQPQTFGINQQQSSSSSLSLTPNPVGPPTCWDSSSSSRVWSDSQLNSSCSSYSAPTPSLFPSPIFLSAHQSHRSYPPGYQPTMPLWPVPSPQGTPIPSLCSSTSTPSIPSLIPDDWYRHQRKKNERPPHRASFYRQSSSGSNSKSSKSRMSRVYANSSSRSRSRSRSKSQGRSRHRSPCSRRRSLHTRYHPSSSYSYGYKRSRSPTPSSSASPRVGHYSRSKSPSDHQKKGHHSRHQSKKSSSSSYISRRRGEQSERETGGSAASLSSPLFAQHTNQTDSLDLEQERYLQWKKEYKEWCEKYFSSYVGHFHQLPLPLLNLLPPPPPPPPPPPQWVDREGSTNNSLANSDSHYQPQGRHTSQLDCHSPSSHSSSSIRSPPSQSSSDSNSTPLQSCSDIGSSPSHTSTNSPSPPSQSSSDGLFTLSENVAQLSAYQQKYSQLSVTLSKTIGEVDLQDRNKEDQEVNMKYLEDFTTQKHDQRRMKRREEGRAEKLSSSAVIEYDECKDGTSVQDEASTCDTLKSMQSSQKPIDKHSERESRETQNLKGQKGWRTGKQSDARQGVEKSYKAKPSKDTDRVDTDPYRNLRGRQRAETKSDKNRKRKGEERERHETQRKSVSPNPIERKKQNREKKEIKTQPLTECDIWEEGIKVKPQKKISININLDGTRSKINQDFSCSQSTAGKTNEENEKTGNEKEGKGKPHKEVSRTKEGVCDEEIGPNKIWEKGTFRAVEIQETFEGEEDHTWEKKKDRENEDFDLWHCALRGAEEEESRRLWEERDGIRAGKGKEVTERRRLTGKREGRERIMNESHEQEETELVQHSQKQESDGKSREITLEELKTNRKEGLMEGVKRTIRKQEDDTMSTQKSHSSNTAVDDGSSCEDRWERTVVKSPEERATEREGELIKVPFSKWDKVSVEEEQDQAEITAQDALPVSAPPPSVVTVNQEKEHNRLKSVDTERDGDGQMQRGRPNTETGKDSRLSGINSTMAPSSSRCRTDSIMCTGRERERGLELERRRDRERGKEGERPRDRQKEGKASKEKRREDEGERYRRTERGHSSTVSVQKRDPLSSGFSSSSSISRDTERRDWHQQSDQGSENKYFHPSGSDRCSISAAVELPDKNAYKIHRGTSLESKSKDKQQSNSYHNRQVLSHTHRRQDRDPLSSESFSLKPRVSSSRRDLKQNKTRNDNMEEKAEWTQNRVNKVIKESKMTRERRELGAEREGGSRGDDINDDKLAGESMWDWRRELEEGERSSSNSSSSASLDNSRNERKKHRREKRQAARELLESRKNTEPREDGGVDVDDEENKEENHSRICSVTLS